jgi:hypothetical protein
MLGQLTPCLTSILTATGLLEKEGAMRIKSFLVAMIFALTTMMWAQNAPVKVSGTSHSGGQLRAKHRQEMMEMHKQEMEAMKADVEKMKSSLAQMKANLLTIRERNELDRWRNNIDMWEVMVGHMDRMLKDMESMGPGMSGSSPAVPTEKKPE